MIGIIQCCIVYFKKRLMKMFLKKIIFITSIQLLLIVIALGQKDSPLPIDDLRSKLLMSKESEYLDLLIPSTFDINRLPINVCIIKKDSINVGFVIAGHALKETCHTASLKIKTILDTIGYQDNTVFSFGVGYDRRNTDPDMLYHNQLKELEKTCLDLQERDMFQVRVRYTSDSSFNNTLERIEGNMRLAWNSMKENKSVNRVVFRYNNIKFPLPIPFYSEDSIVTFTIPKSRIGKIPDTRNIYAATIQNALIEINDAITVNDLVLQRIANYNPIIYTREFGPKKYPVLIANGIRRDTLKDYLIQFDTTKIIKEYDQISGRTIRFYSLSQLQKLCNSNQRTLFLRNSSKNMEINTCEQAENTRYIIGKMTENKLALIARINKINKQLALEKNQLRVLATQLNTHQSADSLIYIDAFLRGWVFATGDPLLNSKLNNWYNKRKTVWRELLTQNPAYKDRIKTAAQASLLDETNNIAGIFQFDNVFFSVKATEHDYIITPYKLLGNDFVQIIDRNNKICQFFSANNFRHLKL
jgi:hypothetical protein